MLTAKYSVGVQQTLDFGETGSRDLDVTLERRLPSWRLQVGASFDQIDDEQSVGVVLIPEGFGNGRFSDIGTMLR